MNLTHLAKLAAAFALALSPVAPAHAQQADFETAFDQAFGTQPRAPRDFAPASDNYASDNYLATSVAQLADGSQGRIGVYAVDLSNGAEVGVLADDWFPLASTSKVAIAAVFLAGVDDGRWSLTSEFRLPRANGPWLTAREHIDLMISKSCNDCTDALLDAVGGPEAVNNWMRNAGVEGFNLTRNIRALVREDGRIDPVFSAVRHDSATPRAMGELLAGIYQGRWLSTQSRAVIMEAMANTTTGQNRMRAGLPQNADLAHKTGTLSRTASDIGIFQMADGRAIAVAIYVTGQSPSMEIENSSRTRKLEARRNRDQRISSIANALYAGFSGSETDGRVWLDANVGG